MFIAPPAFGPWKRFYVLGSQIGGAPGASEWTNVTSGRAAIDVMLRVRNRRLIGYATRSVVGRCHGKSKKENGNELQTGLFGALSAAALSALSGAVQAAPLAGNANELKSGAVSSPIEKAAYRRRRRRHGYRGVSLGLLSGLRLLRRRTVLLRVTDLASGSDSAAVISAVVTATTVERWDWWAAAVPLHTVCTCRSIEVATVFFSQP